MRGNQQGLWDKTWKDSDGEYVIFQMPNAWLIAWAILTFISLLTTGAVASTFFWVGLASLAVWSGLEMFKGVNYFRRVLGLLVAIFVIASAVTTLQ